MKLLDPNPLKRSSSKELLSSNFFKKYSFPADTDQCNFSDSDEHSQTEELLTDKLLKYHKNHDFGKCVKENNILSLNIMSSSLHSAPEGTKNYLQVDSIIENTEEVSIGNMMNSETKIKKSIKNFGSSSFFKKEFNYTEKDELLDSKKNSEKNVIFRRENMKPTQNFLSAN